MEVREFDEIAVDNAETSDASTNEEIGGSRTDRTATDQDGTGGRKALLAVRAEGLKKHLARVFLVERVNHVE